MTTTGRFLKITGVLIFFAYLCNAQSIPISNPSLEGDTGLAKVPAPWFMVEGDADTYPGKPDINYTTQPAASNGKTYIHLDVEALFWLGNTYEPIIESIGQRLPTSTVPGTAYFMTMDLAAMFRIDIPPFDFRVKVVGISSDPQVPAVRFWTSDVLSNTSWKNFGFQFTPTAAYDSILIIPEIDNIVKTGNYGAVLVDNITGLIVALPFTVSHTNNCNGKNDGSATVMGIDPDLHYTYLWTPGNYTTRTITGLSAGNYKVIVTDDAGGKFFGSVTIDNTNVNLQTDVVDVSCYGQTDGQLQVIAKGGIPPYQYSFNGVAGNSGLLNNVRGGTYAVSVQDSLGCAVQEDVYMPLPDPLFINELLVKPVACNTVTDGRITVVMTGGTPPFTYSFNGGAPQSDNIIRGLDQGIYDCLITDRHGCVVDSSVIVDKNFNDCGIYVPTAFSPNGDGKNDLFRIKMQDAITDFRMVIAGRWGNILYQSRDPERGWDGAGAVAGTYAWVMRYTDGKGQAIEQKGWVVLLR